MYKFKSIVFLPFLIVVISLVESCGYREYDDHGYVLDEYSDRVDERAGEGGLGGGRGPAPEQDSKDDNPDPEIPPTTSNRQPVLGEDERPRNFDPNDKEVRCGDGELDINSEECDDGNSEAEDGCSPECIIELDATVPSSISLTTGSTNPVGGVTNVEIPAAGETDSTGAITGWRSNTADEIRFTVIDSADATSIITIDGDNYTSGDDYVIDSTISLNIVVTTSEAGSLTVVRSFTVTVAAAPRTISQNSGQAQYAMQRMGQTFKIPQAAALDSIELTFAMRGTFMGTGQLTVYTDATRSVTVGTATNTILDTSDGELTPVTGTFNFNGVNLSANTSYYFELVDSQNNNEIFLWQISSDVYDDGSAYGGNLGGNASLLNGTGVDCRFVISYSLLGL